MRLKKMDILTLKSAQELEIIGTGRSVFPPDTELVIERVNNLNVYARTDGGTGLGLIVEVRIRRKDVQHRYFDHQERKTEGIAALHERYFGDTSKPRSGSSEPTVIRRPRRAS